MFSSFTNTLVLYALFVFYFNYYVGVLHTICFLLLLLHWYVGTIWFLLSLPFTFVCCALFVSYFLELVRWHVAHYLFSSLFSSYVGVLRTICFLLLLLRWCFAHYFFSTFTLTLVFCALFVFSFHYYVGVLRTICFLLQLLR